MNFHTAECPICMEAFNGTNNQVITECGHTFHTNCLMKSVAHNGFGCPYCRTKMAEDIQESDDEDSYDDEYDGEQYDDEDEEEEEARRREANEPRILGGLRWLFNRANNEDTIVYDNEDDEIEHEHEFGEEDYVLHARPSTPDTPPPSPKPSVEFITKKLVEQGVTMGDVLKVLLLDHEEYDSMEDELNRAEDEIFGKLRILISNYEPEQEVKTELLIIKTDDVTSYYNNRFIRVV